MILTASSVLPAQVRCFQSLRQFVCLLQPPQPQSEIRATSLTSAAVLVRLAPGDRSANLAHIGFSQALVVNCGPDLCQVWVYDSEETDEYECVALLQSHTQAMPQSLKLG